MSVDEATLIARVVKKRDQHAFAELVKQNQSQLRYSLRQLTGWDEALADDLAQETFIKAYQALPGFKGDAKFSSWLYRIAYNLMISHYRKSSNREIPSEIDQSDQTTPDSSSESDLHRDLAKAMFQLPDNQRLALHLFLHKEFSHQEIADVMKVPLGTVKTYINRGRTTLKQLMASWQPGETA